MSIHTFAVAHHANVVLVYDPASGQVRLAARSIGPGLRLLEDTEAATWPTVEPNTLGLEVPISLCWSPLVRCNLECPHCLDDKTLPELGAKQRAEVGRRIAASSVPGVDISGGEPLLMRDLPQLAGALAAAGLAVSVTTNGWHLQRRARELAGRLHAVRVSLDGPDAARHDALRGADSFRRATEGIRVAVAIGVPLQIHTVVMASTLHQCAPMLKLAADLGVNGVTFLQMLPIGEGAAMADAEMLEDNLVESHLAALTVPAGLTIRLRKRTSAGGFTVVRADGQVWRNGRQALNIDAVRPLLRPGDLATASTGDGAA